MTIQEKYTEHCKQPSDIYQLLPYLKDYASLCEHITEMGVRGVVSTYALLSGKPKKVVGYDINRHPNVTECESLAKNEGIEFQFIQADVLSVTIEPTDFLFIDTFHTGTQVKKELDLHASNVRKFIGFHDTTTYWETGESAYPELGVHTTAACGRGLRYGIEPFLAEHPEWKIRFRTPVNNGLLILERV